MSGSSLEQLRNFLQEKLYDRFAPRTGLVLSLLICLFDVKLILMSHDSEGFKR